MGMPVLYKFSLVGLSNQPCLPGVSMSRMSNHAKAIPLLVLGVLAADNVDVLAALSAHTLCYCISACSFDSSSFPRRILPTFCYPAVPCNRHTAS